MANSHAVKMWLETEGIEPVEVIWNGIPIRTERPPLKHPPTAIFAGRLVMEKGIDILIKSFAKISAKIQDAQLLIVGEGQEHERLVSLIEKLNLQNRVKMLGHLSRPTLEQKAAAAWVQVVPSRWAEPFGIVAAEAMMRGTAVIATDAGGLREIVRDEQTGILIPPNNVDCLVDALLRILENRHLAETMGKTGRDVALNNFTEDHFIDKFIDLYHKLLLSNGENKNES